VTGIRSREGIKIDRLAAMEVFIRVVDSGSSSGAAKQLRTRRRWHGFQ
jgi:hypothetical protein